MKKHSILMIVVMITMTMLAVGCNPFSAATGDRARNTPFSVEVRWHAGGAVSSRGLIDDPLVDSVSVNVLNSGGTGIGSGTLSKGAGYWSGTIQVSQTGLATFMATAKDGDGVVLYYGEQEQTLSGANDKVTIAVSLQPRGIVTTFAGTSDADGTGSAAGFCYPNGIASDGTNLYVADTYNCTIRKIVISTGEVTTFAGAAGQAGSADGKGINARFNNPFDITTDGTNLYVADTDNNTIRQIDSSGNVTTLAGTAETAGSTDGPGSEALFDTPGGITTDGTNLYVSDSWNHTIRKIVISSGDVTTLAGTAGESGSADDNGINARFYFPWGITTDGTNLYVSDGWNNTIRQIVISSRDVTTLAGTAGSTGSTDGPGSIALFNWPCGITTDGTNLYVSDSYNNTIRQIVISTSEVTTLAGTAETAGSTDGTGSDARFYGPGGLIIAGSNLYVADSNNNEIRRIIIGTAAVTTLAGTFPYSDGSGTAARFNNPKGITTDGTNLYVADTDNNTIRQIVISSGDVTTLAGTAETAGSTDGPGNTALFNSPCGITTDGTNLYVADTHNHTIRQIVISSGEVTTLAGTAGLSGSSNGNGSNARFFLPQGITTDGTNLYVADTINYTIRQIVISGAEVTTLAGSARQSGSTDGKGSIARFNNPSSITTDGTNLYVADSSNHTIRKIVISSGDVTTLSGTAGSAGSDDATGSYALFNYPGGITTDGTILYVADSGNATIRKIVISTAEVTTLAGTAGEFGSTDGTGSIARFAEPCGIATSGANLYVVDIWNCSIRKIE